MAEDSPFGGVSPLINLLGRSLEEGETTRYSRTDILRSLMYPLGLCVGALPLLALAKVPAWTLIGDGVAIAVLLSVYLGAYLYSFVARPDTLRSERYQLAKYALESQMFGDNRSGLIEAAPVRTVQAPPTGVGSLPR